MASAQRSALALAGLLAGAAAVHLVHPQTFDPLIPAWLPGRSRTWSLGSGLMELGCAVAVAIPATRSLGGYASATLFVAVFPGNIQMLVDAKTSRERAVLAARLPLQVPLVRWAWRVARPAIG